MYTRKTNWRSTVLWSVIAAAFVGPGTVTTATRAGSEGSYAYLWPLLLALLAGYLLMEMVARVTVVTGDHLGGVVDRRFGRWMSAGLFGGVLLGCAAYQAGNLLGSFGGLSLFTDLDRKWVLLVGAAIFGLLWYGDVKTLGRLLAGVVLLMGTAFLYTGFSVGFKPMPSDVAAARSVSVDTVLALIGTTIVPYNFFLAAGLGKSQEIGEMRLGLAVSFGVGGLITLGILLTGHALIDFDNFADLATVLERNLGANGGWLLGIGLFAAGFSSAITAPLAAAMAGRILLQRPESAWSQRGRWYRLTWMGVLTMGVFVAVLELRLIPVILAAQLVNGLLVPVLAALVIYLGNDRNLLGERVNNGWQNALGLLVFGYITFQGLRKIAKVIGLDEWELFVAGPGCLVGLSLLVWGIIKARRLTVRS